MKKATLVVLAVSVLALSGCGLFHHRHHHHRASVDITSPVA